MRPPLPGLLYTIPPSLYISLTNAVNGTPLLATRGPGFPFATRFVPLPRGGAEPTAADVALRDAGLHSVSVALNAHDEASYARVMNLAPPAATDPATTAAAAAAAAAAPAADAVDGGVGAGAAGAPSADGSAATLADVLAFVADCAAVNLPGGVEVTCVEAPGVRIGAAQRLALEAGADAFRVRSWFGILGGEET
ncbi:hypothetical protein I4F81_011905 [Pyropia yezoensis]|uniref:Uncharacterized protein n=1 Tax=Pyropia yezoensis TaxID=2788 RepID=A0ACC3CGX6_PYRYE|nr:hypothetical protein I4F81_011905 [Neopyropia yezoensis]